jgi:hypothetical protein
MTTIKSTVQGSNSIRATLKGQNEITIASAAAAPTAFAVDAILVRPELQSATFSDSPNFPQFKGLYGSPTFKIQSAKTLNPYVAYSYSPANGKQTIQYGLPTANDGSTRNVTSTHYGNFIVDITGGASGTMPSGSGIKTDGSIFASNGTIKGDTIDGNLGRFGDIESTLANIRNLVVSSKVNALGFVLGGAEFSHPVDIRDDVRIRPTGNLYVGGGTYSNLSNNANSPYTSPTGRAYFRYSPHMPGFKLQHGSNTPNVRTELGLGLSDSPVFAGVKLSTTPVYENNTTAASGGLPVGAIYRTSTGVLMIRF